MTDQLINRVATLAGQTAILLKEMEGALRDSGLSAHGDRCADLSRRHGEIEKDCLIETQPLEIDQRPISTRLRDAAETARQIATSMMMKGMLGHALVSEAATNFDLAATDADARAR